MNRSVFEKRKSRRYANVLVAICVIWLSLRKNGKLYNCVPTHSDSVGIMVESFSPLIATNSIAMGFAHWSTSFSSDHICTEKSKRFTGIFAVSTVTSCAKLRNSYVTQYHTMIQIFEREIFASAPSRLAIKNGDTSITMLQCCSSSFACALLVWHQLYSRVCILNRHPQAKLMFLCSQLRNNFKWERQAFAF